MIRYVKGDATKPIGDGPKVIVHCCNDIGAWGRGFVLAISKIWRGPEEKYRRWSNGHFNRNKMTPWRPDPFILGMCQFVDVERGLTVCNLIGQEDIRPHNGIPPIRYDAIRVGLREVLEFCHRYNASVHMPRMGAGLAGGDWAKIAAIVDDELDGIDVTVYDWEG